MLLQKYVKLFAILEIQTVKLTYKQKVTFFTINQIWLICHPSSQR